MSLIDDIDRTNGRWQIADATLEHQLQLIWASGKREVVPKCNCGWVGTARRPDHPEPELNTLGMTAEYEGHLASVR